LRVAGSRRDEVETTAMCLGDASRDGETKSRATVVSLLPRPGCLDAEESLKQPVNRFGRYARTCVDDRDVDRSVLSHHADRHRPSGWRVLDGVVEQIQHDATQQVR